jgi:tetratricopeptide (TPR) repeat protein
MNNFAETLRNLGKFDEAIELGEGALDLSRRIYGPDHPSTLATAGNHALLLMTVGRYDDAEALFADTIERDRRVLGEDHPRTLLARSNRALVLQDQLRLDEAEAEFRDLAVRFAKVQGEDHPNTLIAQNNIASLRAQRGDFAAAESIYRSMLPRVRKAMGEKHPYTLSTEMRLGHVLDQEQKWRDAEPLLAEAYAQAKVAGLTDAQAGYAAEYGVCLANVGGKANQALPLLSEAEDRMSRLPRPDVAARRQVAEAAILAATQLGRASDVDAWRAKLKAFDNLPTTHPAATASTQP